METLQDFVRRTEADSRERRRQAILLANFAILELNKVLEETGKFRRSVMGQGCAVNYDLVINQERKAKSCALERIDECIRLDPSNSDLQEIHKKLIWSVPGARESLKETNPERYRNYFGDNSLPPPMKKKQVRLRNIVRHIREFSIDLFYRF